MPYGHYDYYIGTRFHDDDRSRRRNRSYDDTYHPGYSYRSRYGGRNEQDRRSRSPRDRSPPPYGDRYGDGDRRRLSPVSRANSAGFQSGRDGFRDTLTGRDPPRAPKALLDSPGNPRGGGFRRTGGGNNPVAAGRGRGWRDDSRDRGRDRDPDYRDRPHFRDERSRERERDWGRDRERGDFRGRRPSPQGRGRSPVGRDFRDGRDPPLGVDSERARRGSRDGPLSAGSSSSDPPFGPPSFRNAPFPPARGGRGGGRGRGAEWDRAGRGRGGNFYDDRDRYPGPRSRSQEGRWTRDQEDRDRRDGRYADMARDHRDDRDLRDRDRDLIRPKLDRVSHEPPSMTKDVSPPPLAPSAPAFGSVPSRQTSITDIQSLTGKLPPTGPRALTEERPNSAGHSPASDRPLPTGPSKPSSVDGSPPIPAGPRGQKPQQQRSSKQWINPTLAGKKIPDSPKSTRSQSFASPPRPPGSIRPGSSHSDKTSDPDRRPRSSGAQSDPQVAAADGQLQDLHLSESDDGEIKEEEETYSRRASVDREPRASPHADVVMGGVNDVAEPVEEPMSKELEPKQEPALEDGERQTQSPTLADPDAMEQDQADQAEQAQLADQALQADQAFQAEQAEEVERQVRDETQAHEPEPAEPAIPEQQPEDSEKMETEDADDSSDIDDLSPLLTIPSVRVQLPERQHSAPTADQSSDSDTDEDMDDYFKKEIANVESILQKAEDAGGGAPIRIVARYAAALNDSMLRVLNEPHPLTSVIGTLPDGLVFTVPRGTTPPVGEQKPLDQPIEAQPAAEPETKPEAEPVPAPETAAIPTVETSDEAPAQPPEPLPKMEEMDMEGFGLPLLPTVEQASGLDEDVEMQDAAEALDTLGPLPATTVPTPAEGLGIFQSEFDGATSAQSSPSAMDEDSEDRTEDDASIYGSVEAVREFSATPPTEELPVYNLKPWFESKRARKLLKQSEGFDSFMRARLQEQMENTREAQEELKDEYKKKYDSYLRFTLSDDPVAIKSREAFASTGSKDTSGGKSAPVADSKPEGGRRNASRNATELDMEWVLEQSRREHQEKEDREKRAQSEKYPSEKEAVIPDMIWMGEEKGHELFHDTTGLLPIEKLVAAWHVVPWHVNFTEEEEEKFEKAYLEFPKQWGKIAKELPNRDFGSCIQYYYAKKRELNLKEKLRKRPKTKRRGNKKTRSSALVSELGNAENENDENGQEAGENGERRRPRRAAAPTWGYEATQNADSDGATPAATPGSRRRGAAATAAAAAAAANADAKGDSGAEKPEVKKTRRARQTKAEKEAKASKPAQALAPTPGAGPVKGNRSRSNSKAQGPEWSGADEMSGRFSMPPGTMQPPSLPAQQQVLGGHERAPPLASGLSEVMAPPSLRPEPPPPLASVPTFDVGQSPGPERGRVAQQASSYWSVAESNDFPNYLRAFGTDWAAIATHMQTKTAVMVKNFFVRQKEGAKPEWEGLAMDADAKRLRGEKRPAPPMPMTGVVRKRFDSVSSTHRTLAAAEPEDMATKSEPGPPHQPFTTRFPVPIAQASPVSHPLSIAQVSSSVAAPASAPAPVPQQQPTSGPPPAQVLSPSSHSLRPPHPFSYPEKEREPVVPPPPPVHTPQAPVRIQPGHQKPGPASLPQQTVPEPPQRPVGWPTDADHQLSILTQKEPREMREVRERQARAEISPREPLRPAERPPARLKQEPDQPLQHPEPYQPFPPSQRPVQPRPEPVPLGRQPEHLRQPAAPQPFAQPSRAQPVGSLLSDPISAPQVHPQMGGPVERPHPTVQRPMQPSVQDQYAASPVSAQPTPTSLAPPPAARPAERKTSSLMALLNDDPPAPPKRMTEVKANPTPPPQPIASRPQPSPAPVAQRREDTPGYYSRNPGQPPQSAIPPLKPYHTQSPQPTHVNAPRSMDPAGQAERDYYARHQQFQSQHQTSAANSPQSHQTHHYPPTAQHAPQHAQHAQHSQQHAQHAQQQAQQHSQGPPMSYQGQQQGYQGYSTQPHASSPTPSYASHAAMAGRREQPQTTREPWPPSQQPGATAVQQQPQQQQQQQQQQQHHQHGQHQQHQQHSQHAQHQQQPSWPPPHQGPPKTQAPPAPPLTPWAAQQAQHVAPPKPQVSTSMASQPHSWPTPTSAGPQQSHLLNLREPPRGPPAYASHDSQSPTAGMIHHQHQASLGGGRYAAPPDPRRVEQVQQPGQPYRGYSGTPGPGQREPVRSYTPVGFDPRGPAPPPYAGQDAREAQQLQLREAQMREAHNQNLLGRQLRPHHEYNPNQPPPPDRRY